MKRLKLMQIHSFKFDFAYRWDRYILIINVLKKLILTIKGVISTTKSITLYLKIINTLLKKMEFYLYLILF